MKKNLAQKIWKACFILAIVLAFVLWCVVLGECIQFGQEDDGKLVANFVIPILFLILAIGSLQGFLFYVSVRFFLANSEYKTWKKGLLYGALFLVNLFVVIKEIAYILH